MRMIVDLFCEDRAHEEFLDPLISRIGEAEGYDLSVRVLSATGGHPRAIQEFKNYQRAVSSVIKRDADIVVVAIDGNCSSFAKARERVHNVAVSAVADRLVVASPDPHIERWYMADPQAILAVLSCDVPSMEGKCERHYYKNALRKIIKKGGNIFPLDDEFAPDLVAEMDLYRAGKNDSSFKAFVDDLKTKLRTGPAAGRS